MPGTYGGRHGREQRQMTSEKTALYNLVESFEEIEQDAETDISEAYFSLKSAVLTELEAIGYDPDDRH